MKNSERAAAIAEAAESIKSHDGLAEAASRLAGEIGVSEEEAASCIRRWFSQRMRDQLADEGWDVSDIG